jgi:hypothetical protein
MILGRSRREAVQIQSAPSSQFGLCASLVTAAENCRIRAGLCKSKGTGERTNAEYQGDFRQFLSVGGRAGSLQAISVNLRPAECTALCAAARALRGGLL